MVLLGIVLISSSNEFKKTSATILQPVSCIPMKDYINCTFSYQYNAPVVDQNNQSTQKTFTQTIDTQGSTDYRVVKNIDVFYDTKKPSTSIISDTNPKKYGVILINMAILIIFISYLWFYFAQQNKFISTGLAIAVIIGVIVMFSCRKIIR